MWDLPRPGLEPVSPALAGVFLTTAPPGKPPRVNIKSKASGVLDLSSLFHVIAAQVLGTLEKNESDDIVVVYYREKD